jgi:predicted AlkP superfamily phosphohydrolase/phosphomutase
MVFLIESSLPPIVLPENAVASVIERTMRRQQRYSISILFMVALCAPSVCHAYIGPGAGFAFLSSFIFIFGAILVALLSILTLPIRLLFKRLRSKKAFSKAKADRVVVLGLDGMDPELAAAFMDEGKLPHLSRLREEGCFSPLKTSNPPISPVAWSCFMTGVNPGKHNIFDFLRREPKNYLPGLSSADIGETKRSIRLGRYKIPIGKPSIRMLRKSVPFWKILGEHGIFSIILKVPITFPPEKFSGILLSGLCTPDVKGSQGTFAFYSNAETAGREYTSGYTVQLKGEGPCFKTVVRGPKNPFRDDIELEIPMEIHIGEDGKSAGLRIDGQHLTLNVGRLSDWIPLRFKAGLTTRINGIAQFFLKKASPHLELYLSPIHIDPEKPALPISYPLTYSVYLSKLLGSYATLGLPQDTWALNEEVLTDDGFLQQTYGVHEKLEEIFFHSLSQIKKGLLCCVFDTTDVVQHEFWRYLGDDHPALKGDRTPKPPVIEELYKRMDATVGRILQKLQPGDLFIILSDHGFKLFRRGVNLNTWLLKNGYLNLKSGKTTGEEWFKGVDWSKTKAYAFGLSGIYLNVKGREAQGIVAPGEADSLKAELTKGLSGLKDAELGREAITAIYDTKKIYRGPYIENGPDLIVGHNPGYRTSWDSVTGKITSEVFMDNDKAWSADHCIDHRFVPGVFFCNRRVNGSEHSIQDLAPTVLDLFGIRPPSYMDGKIIGINLAARNS